MNRFSFLGRPDGLGNRIEEIIRLEAICAKADSRCEYIWRNRHAGRSYDIRIRADLVDIKEECEPSHSVKRFADFHFDFTQADMVAAASKITPDFSLSFPGRVRPVGVHIRGTDRIGSDHPQFMKDESELKMYLSDTLSAINESPPSCLFLCSESRQCKRVFRQYLSADNRLVEPSADTSIPRDYLDLFALALCEEIWMVSRFSSYSIIAALMGNVRVITFVDDAEVRGRYKADLCCRQLSGKQFISESLLDRTGIVSRFIDWIKG